MDRIADPEVDAPSDDFDWDRWIETFENVEPDYADPDPTPAYGTPRV